MPASPGDDYVTVPFFALAADRLRRAKNMDKQTDAHKVNGVKLGNVQTVTAHGDGSEVDTFFGCWLDINQAAKHPSPRRKDTVHPGWTVSEHLQSSAADSASNVPPISTSA